MISKELIYFILILIGVFVLYYLYRKNFKILKVPSICLITGGVKVGKSLLSVKLSQIDYKKRHIKWWIKYHIFGKKDLEEPLLYTNCSSYTFGNRKIKEKTGKCHRLDKNIRYIDTDLLLRNKRYAYGSVVYVQESSLLADNMDFNNKERNILLSIFNKLFGHETKGGALYYDTQSPLDNHYSIKRVSSTYFFIMKNVNFLLFHVLYVREMINTENGVNNFVDDVEMTMRKVLVPFWYHHRYDRYEYSYLTDDLSVGGHQRCNDGLVSFNPDYIRLSDKRIKGVKK